MHFTTHGLTLAPFHIADDQALVASHQAVTLRNGWTRASRRQLSGRPVRCAS